jgi:hypothetical protein
MYIFWENVFRFPRFFITSVSGLIVILLTPLLKLAKKNLLSQIFLLGFLILVISCLVFVFQGMLDL